MGNLERIVVLDWDFRVRNAALCLESFALRTILYLVKFDALRLCFGGIARGAACLAYYTARIAAPRLRGGTERLPILSQSKIYPDAHTALAGIVEDGMTIAVGGFGLCGIPESLITALRDSGKTSLTIASNNAGIDNYGLGLLLQTRQVRKMISSYVGENREFERQFLAGTLEVEFCPQGTLAERMRAGGAGIPGFYTRTGVGTSVAEGKEHREFDGHTHILERGIRADLALVKAWKGDAAGNLIYRKTARNFNPNAATCGRVTVAEVEILVEIGELDADQVHTPGIFVQRIVHNPAPEKRIEQRTTRKG